MICPPCTHFSFFFDCFCFLCLTVCIPRNCTFCYISFELRRWFLILFCGLGGRAAGWQVYHSLHLRGMPTCLLVPKCISLPSLYGVLLHDAFPDYRDTEWSKTIPLLRENRYHGIPPCICHRKKQGQASVHLRIILTRYSLRRYLSILRRIYIYIYIYTFEKSRNVWSSNYTGQQLAAGFSIRVFHQSTSTVQCCIRVVLPLTRSTKLRAADKDTFLKQV